MLSEVVQLHERVEKLKRMVIAAVEMAHGLGDYPEHHGFPFGVLHGMESCSNHLCVTFRVALEEELSS